MVQSVARIGYENLLESGTVVASSEDADNPIENAYDGLTSDFFKPAASGTINIDLTLSVADGADYFAFFGHDLYAHGGTIKLQYWDGAAYVDCFAAETPTDNTPRMISFASQVSAKWRVVITCTSVFSIACIAFGAQLALEYGMYLNWTPPKFGRSTQLINSMSDGGNFLGRTVIANGVVSSLDVQYASDAWMRANWLPFVRRIEQKPFFFVPNISAYPFDCVYAWTGDSIPAPKHTQFGFMGASIPIMGMVE